MKFDIVEINIGDTVMTPIDIGSLPPTEVDQYCKKNLKFLKEIFGCRVAILPMRGTEWDFTIIRNPNRKKEKSYANTLRKRTLSRRDR